MVMATASLRAKACGSHDRRTQGPMRRLTLAMLAVLVVGGSAAGTSAASGAPHQSGKALKPPRSTVGQLSAVAGVPGAHLVWAVGYAGGGSDFHYFEARRQDGRWTRVKSPKLGGLRGSINAIAAPAVGTVWLAGARQQPHGSLPSIWRWTGKRFALARLPSLVGGAARVVKSLSASSATNAWAVGPMFLANKTQVTLHWDGHAWSAVAFPAGLEGQGLTAVSTSGPRNAWALRSDGEMEHWNGTAWSVQGTAAPGVDLVGIATSGPKLAYAVGFMHLDHGAYRTIILRFNGISWSNAPLAAGTTRVGVFSVTMRGASAWVVGSHITANGVPLPVILHSTGGTWSAQQPPGGKAFRLFAVSAGSAKRVYAVGSHFHVGTPARTFFDYYNGGSWQGRPSGF
jgi:hypothetical protein